MCGCSCACMCGVLRLTLGVFLHHFLLYFLRQDLSLFWSLPFYLDGLASEPLGILVSVTSNSNAGIIGMCCHTGILCVLRIPYQVFMISSSYNSQHYCIYPVSHLPKGLPPPQGLRASHPAWLAFSWNPPISLEMPFLTCHINQFL